MSITFYGQTQNGGACVYMIPNDSTIICNVYGNGGLPNQVACYNDADAAGAIPINCFDYLSCAASTYPDPSGNGCFYAGTGSCGGSNNVCDLIALPVELIRFEGEKDGNTNIITWTTASEANSDYYTLYVYNRDMEIYYTFSISGMGNSSNITNYRLIHHYPNKDLNYYQLIQYDLDGKFENFGYLSIDNSVKPRVITKKLNLLGQDIDEFYNGLVIIHYDDGSIEKKFQ